MTFNFTSQICTSHSQSERLLALGLKKETADMAYEYKPKHLADTDTDKDWVIVAHSPCGTDIPAWSLNRLIEMMPQGIQDCSYRCFVLVVNSQGVSYEYHYIDEEGKGYEDSIGCTDLFDTLYDDIIAHIEWLIKEGYFNKKYLEE
jgi:hypothetical protein